jgi:outer membrane receptor for monomeric catechols
MVTLSSTELRCAQNTPCLSQFAIDILTIPASSCECERLFSELGDLLEPKRRAIGSELLAALQLVRAWTRAGYTTMKASETHSSNGDSNDSSSKSFTDDSVAREYDTYNWTDSLEIVTLGE